MSKKGRDYVLFLNDILNAIKKIERYTKDLSFEDFCNNDMAIDAVIRNFEVIGEATRNIPNKVCEKYPDVEWKEAIGFRYVLVHDYFGIDVEAVWGTIKNNLTPFKKHIVRVLRSEEGEKQLD